MSAIAVQPTALTRSPIVTYASGGRKSSTAPRETG
jgi:hypothetical protein